MPWIILSLAIIFEVSWAVLLKLSAGFTKPWPSAGTVIFYVLSLVALSFAVKRIDLSVAYAVWAGVGMALIAAIGMIWLSEPVSAMKIICIGLIAVGVVGLNLSAAQH